MSPKREAVAENEKLAFEVKQKSEPNNETDLKFDDESFQVIANMTGIGTSYSWAWFLY